MKLKYLTTTRLRTYAAGIVFGLLSLTCWAEPRVYEMDLPSIDATEEAAGYIIQANSVEAAAEAVKAVGGEVSYEISTIQAVGASLLPVQVELLKRRSDIHRVFEDTVIQTSQTPGSGRGLVQQDSSKGSSTG